MRIGLLETIPILREKLKRERNAYPCGERIVAESLRRGARYDLILSDKSYFPCSFPCHAEIFLIPGNARIDAIPEEGLLLTGGMAHSDTVSFSSIGEEDALLCVQREIFLMGKSILPFEQKVHFDRNFSLYKNLATGFALALARILFTEEL